MVNVKFDKIYIVCLFQDQGILSSRTLPPLNSTFSSGRALPPLGSLSASRDAPLHRTLPAVSREGTVFLNFVEQYLK